MLKIVQTENGKVRGILGNNTRISVFRGIPFALPPVGANRWKAPLPCKNWDGILDATEFAPISMQSTPGLGDDIYSREWHVDSDIAMDEDCLYLNVWTPAKAETDNLPVLVWFFGGGFQWGYPSEMEFCGENIAKRGVIVVSVNYRLGAFGFLSHPDLTSESPSAPTNFGLLDQLAGLKWVKRNIASFGGNPNNITIAGQSAGGASVLSHLTSKQSIGNYNRAIILSGLFKNPYYTDKFITPCTLEEAEEKGVNFLKFLGVSSIDEARLLDAKYLSDKYDEYANLNPRFATVLDNSFLENEPYKAFVNGMGADVPIITGYTTDEFVSPLPAADENEFINKATEIFGEKVSEFLAFEEAHVKTDLGYAPCKGIELAGKHACSSNKSPSYFYTFDVDIPGDDNPGTFHSVDLWFFFDNLGLCHRPFTGRHFDIARNICNYFTNFIKNGDPNGNDIDKKPMNEWLPYDKNIGNEMYFGKDGCKSRNVKSAFSDFLTDKIAADNALKKQVFNPYLPSWEYIPDGEPYVFGDRVYVYGSHDKFNGSGFCLNDYVCWSAPISDLTDWKYEGVIYRRTDDPENKEKNKMCLYAPDVTIGPDGRYYLFYVLDKWSIVSVAVCDTPAGKYEFLGYVHHKDGTLLGNKDTDEPQFDPGVITIGDKTYLYTGFCGHGDTTRSGAMVTVLASDMLTVLEGPKIIVPGGCYSDGTEYEGHGFFEAPSIRLFDNKYYFIYSSQVMHELCYATSDSPMGPFSYGGVIVSNADMHIDSYKPSDKPTAFGGNNHGSLIEINGIRYIFYHRHTNNTWYSRQGCAEKVTFLEDGKIMQSEITSCGLNDGPLTDTEEYPSYIACNLFNDNKEIYVGGHNVPRVTQEGRDGDRNPGYIASITDGANIGFKYFDCKKVKGLAIKVRGYADGYFEVKLSPDGPSLSKIPVEYSTVWEEYSACLDIPDGVNALYLRYCGGGTAELKSFRFLH